IPANLPNAADLFVAPFVRWIPVISDRVHGFSSGSVVGKSTGMSYTNVSMPLWGEAHLTGGLVGIIVAFAALGILLGLIRQPVLGAVAFRARPSSLLIDAPVAALLFVVLRGSLYEVLGYLIFAVVLGFVAWLIARSGISGVMPAGADFQNAQLRPRTVAFYLPQFHTIPQNDEWWGAGFTEWSNVAKATPLFDGHDHPRRVGELDEYDLTEVQVMHNQAALAYDADIDAFCFYFYWFGGTRLLEKPLDNYLERGPDFPFCISWANESWTRRWDGKDKESLIAQEYSSSTAIDVFDSFLPYLTDPRYLRVGGAAVIVVHRADHLPAGQNFGEIWKQRAKELGIGELHLIAAETNSGIDPRVLKFDAVSEFPPVGSNTLNAARLRPPKGLTPGFRGRLMSYPRLARSFMRRPESQFVRYRGVAPSWDNSARRHENATIYADASPYEYKKWLTHARAYESSERGSNGLVFVNAWNEWAEGAYLEPDVTNGRMYLEATKLTGGVSIPQPSQPLSGPVNVAWIRSLALAAAGSAIKMLRDTRRSFSIFSRW
ncbi:MAG: glycoside hydrolase family 99-like domain-containing protein, partial [Kineosporiaceae bacterium]|nr:glycoside hydrolase family 99-like domain-containing protein [Aeromicrobium sp.]